MDVITVRVYKRTLMWLITGIFDTLVAKTSYMSSNVRSCLKLRKSTKGANPCKF